MARNALIRIGGAEVVTVFEDRLDDDETPDWEDAARALAWIGEDGLPALLALAQDERSSRRSLAVALLARSGHPEVAERVLLEALHDPDPWVRSSAIDQLGKPEYRWMFERVAEMARSEDRSVRGPAIAAIAGMADPRGTQILIDALFEGRTLTTPRAAAALATICTPEALEALVRALESDDTTTMNAAAGAYARVYGEDAAESLIALLRRGVAGEGPALSTHTLATIAHRLPPEVFVALLTDDDEDIRDCVMLPVESICRGHPERIEHYLAHDDEDVRPRAVRIYLMREVGGDPIRTMPLLGDPSEEVRERTAISLARYAAEDHTIAVEELRHPDPAVVAKAARIVGEAEVTGAADALLRLLSGDETECAAEAALALGKLGEERAIKPLIEALGEAPGPVRVAAADALGMLRATEAIDELIASLSDVNQAVRSNAAGALAAIGRPAISALGEAATSSDPWVRGGAINALSRIDDPRAEATLERVREPRRDVTPSSSAIPLP